VTTNATLHTADGRTVLEMQRRFAHPVDRVWRAVTEPEELHHWFPSEVEVDLRVGGKMRFPWRTSDWPVQDGEVLELDPPRVFAFTWDAETMRFELRPDGDGCLMLFSHTFDDRSGAPNFASGWHICFDGLYALLDGEPIPPPAEVPTPRSQELEAQYREQLV